MSRIEQALNEPHSQVPGIGSAIVASPDGPLIAGRGAGATGNRRAAMAATGLGLGRRIARTAQAGAFHELAVRGKCGYLAVFAVGNRASPALTLPEGGNLGLLGQEAEAAVGRVLEGLWAFRN